MLRAPWLKLVGMEWPLGSERPAAIERPAPVKLLLGMSEGFTWPCASLMQDPSCAQ